ncbi:MAG: hypothetical protein V1709_10210, partial [Planctomycetota bacterium]
DSTTMAPAPGTVGNGGKLLSTNNDYLYAKQGSSGGVGGPGFWRYSISENSWETLATTPVGDGGLVYDGVNYIYSLSGSAFQRYNISGGTWSSMASSPGTEQGAISCYPGSGDYIYTLACRGYNCWRYSISGNSWDTMPGIPTSAGRGSALCYPDSGIYMYGEGGSNNFYRFTLWGYLSSGSYISASITPASVSSWGVLTFTSNALVNTTCTVDVLRASDNYTLISNVSSGTNLSTNPIMNGVTSIKLRANFTTTDTTITPTIFDWGIGYEGP